MKSHMFNYQWKEIADVDGNGKADIIMRQGQDIFIRRGNSNGLFDDYKWPSDWKKSPLLVPYWKFDDMNGDGKIDFLGKETGRMFIIPSDGNAWYKYCNNTVQLVIF